MSLHFLNVGPTYWTCLPWPLMLFQLSLLNMSEYARMCLDKQDFIYGSSPKYAKILNMAGFSICERYMAFWICQNMPWQSSKYVRILNIQELHRVLDMSQYRWLCLNGTWICLNMYKFSIIDRILNPFMTEADII